MGMIYMGAYADQIGDHEGYAARILPDGTETSRVLDLSEFTGHRAACACGWRSTTVYPPTDAGEQDADDDWTREHRQPLVDAEASRHTITGDTLIRHIRDLRRQADRRPHTDDGGLDDRAMGLADAAAQLDALLDGLVREEVTT